jgi:hypothetical protein
MPVTFGSGIEVQGALFARGFGLTLAQSQQLGTLAEDPHTSPPHDRDTLFHAGHVTAPWSIYVSDASAEVRLTMQSQASPTGAVTAQLSSHGVQAAWSGKAQGEFRIGGRAVSLAPAGSDHQALQLHYRVEEKPQQPVIFSLRCETDARCAMAAGKGLDLSERFRAATPGAWQTLTLPLACLKRLGATLSAVNAPLALESAGRFAVSFDDIRVVRRAGAPACPPNT